MIDGLKSYSAYRDSRVPWLSETPAHWQVRRLKTVCSGSALYGANIAATSYATSGVRFLRTTDITEDGYLKSGGVLISEELAREYLLGDGDLLISRSGTIGRSFLYDEATQGPCAYAGYLVRFIANLEVSPKYIYLFTKTQAFLDFLKVMAISSTIENVNGEKYANCPLPLPPLHEQAAIVSFLDYADRRIRRYIRAKEKLIALLEEQKRAIIHQAVTGRIDVRTGLPYPTYKPSGVEWLGDVPAHWEVRKLGQCGMITKGNGGSKEDELFDGIPCVRYGDLYTTHKYAISKSRSCISIAKSNEYTRLEYGDVLFAASGETIEDIGKSAVNLMQEEARCGGDIILFRSKREFDARHLGYLMDCPAAISQKATMGRGITVMHIYGTQLKNLTLPIAPLREQTAIAHFLDDATSKIDNGIAGARVETDLIREFRTRLIADVVTGKLDVREAAAALPEVDPLADDDERTILSMPATRPRSTTRDWRRSWADRAAACRAEDLPHRPRGPAGVDRRGRWPMVRCGAATPRASGTTIGMSHIKQRRLTYRLSSHPRLRVGDCVPFYFCPRSVMLYVIHRADNEGLQYRDGQGPIVHLEADLHEAVE